jgi:hypothetical protein
MTARQSKETPLPPRRIQRWIIAVAGLALVALAAVVWLTRETPTGPDPIAPAVMDGPPLFRDVTADSGVHFAYRNGEEAKQYSILESLGGGVALLDLDGDGLLDIFVTGGGYFDGPDKHQLRGHPCKLYRNLGNWKFQDVTAEAGLERDWPYTHGVAVADYDRDGWPDLLVTGYDKILLLRNAPGGKFGRRFIDVTAELGLIDTAWSTSAGWADLDGDGWPDLYVCHYLDWSLARNNPVCKGVIPGVEREVCGPRQFQPLRHALYRNEQGRRLRDVSAEHHFTAAGSGLGVLLADVNDDGRPDIFVANDGQNKFLFLNRGERGLEETALAAGAAVDDNGHPTSSMGVDAADYDGTGRPSLWVTNFQGELHGLYRNVGGDMFDYRSRQVGLPLLGINFVGFGTSFLDLDNDGWEDLVIVNGHVLLRPSGSTLLQRPVLLRNVEQDRQRFFRDISGQGGAYFQTPARGRGLAVGDLDNDGWPDLVISHTNSPVALLRNEAGPRGAAHWLGFRLVGRDHRDVVGSTVIVEAGERRLTRFAKGGGSYLSASDPRILFGLGSAAPLRKVTVKWSWGATQEWRDLEPGGYWELHEGESAARRVRQPDR